jgi:hypothetical protein
VTLVRAYQKPQEMYNLEVARANSFSVGSSGWIVHNAGVPDFLYRGDSRAFMIAFKQGFYAPGKNLNPIEHLLYENPDDSGFISTTTSPDVAAEYSSPCRFIYIIKRQPNAIDVTPLILKSPKKSGLKDHLDDFEWLVPYGIPPEDIVGAVPLDKNGKPVNMDDPIINPFYRP